MDHGVLVQPDLNPSLKQLSKEGSGDPVRQNVVRVFRDQDPDPDAPLTRANQGCKEFPVGDEVGGRELQAFPTLLDRLEVLAPYREK